MLEINSLFKHKLLTIVSLLILITLGACQKKDDLAPSVSIQIPSGGSYSAMDTLYIKAQITDNVNINRISIKIIDQNNQQICPSYNFFPNRSSFLLESSFIINNLYLSSGSYFLIIEAYDGTNIGKSYIPIQIGAISKKLEDILIVERYTNHTEIYSILNGKTLLKDFPFSYQDFIYNPYAKQYQLLTSNGDLIAFNKSNFDEEWCVSGLKDPARNYYGKLFYKDQHTYVSSYLGEIRSYDEKGNLGIQANTVDTKGQISNYFFNQDKIMAIKKPYVNYQDKIEELNKITGASIYTYDLQFSPESILFVDDELCVVFGNRDQVAQACSLSTLYHVIHPFGDFQDRELSDAIQYSEYYYILSLNHEIIEYELDNSYERILETTNTNVHFFKEDLYEKTYYIDNNEILALRYPAAGSQVFFQNDKTIDDLIFVYNK